MSRKPLIRGKENKDDDDDDEDDDDGGSSVDDDPPTPSDGSSVSSASSSDSDEKATSRAMRNFGMNVKKARKLVEVKKKEMEKFRIKVNTAIAPMSGFSRRDWKWIYNYFKKKDKNDIKEKEKLAAELLKHALEDSEVYDKLSERCQLAFAKNKMSDIYKELWTNGWPQGLFSVFINKFLKFERLHFAYIWRKKDRKDIKNNFLKLLQRQLDLSRKIDEDKVLQSGEYKMKWYYYNWFMKVMEFNDKKYLYKLYEGDRRSRIVAASADSGDTDVQGARQTPSYCYYFNFSYCVRGNKCPYGHFCLQCGKLHAAIECDRVIKEVKKVLSSSGELPPPRSRRRQYFNNFNDGYGYNNTAYYGGSTYTGGYNNNNDYDNYDNYENYGNFDNVSGNGGRGGRGRGKGRGRGGRGRGGRGRGGRGRGGRGRGRGGRGRGNGANNGGHPS